MSKKKHILRGVGASAVAVTSIISGLSLGSAAIAATEAPSVSFAKAQRLNPPAPRNIRATQITNYDVTFSFDLPPKPASGYQYTLPCIGPEENPFANCTATLANGSSTSWNSVKYWGGFGSNWKPGQTRNMVLTTVLKDNNGVDTHGRTSYSVTRPWFLTATAQYSIASDAFRLTGTTKDNDATVQVSADGGSTWTTVTSAADHEFDLTLDRELTAGGTIRVREGLTGDGTVVSLRSAAVTQLAASEANKKRLLSGKAANNAKVHVSASDLASDDYLSFNASANGSFEDIDLSAVPQQVREVTVWQGDNGIRTRVQLPTLLGAVAKDIDIEAGTATLDGFAPEGATAVDVTWNGVTRDATVNADGSWSFDLTGLKLGSNTVRIEAWNGSESYGEFTLDVNLAVAGLTANATFDDDASKDVTLAGTGQAGATVEVRSGEKIVAKTTVGQGNTWSVQLPAPDTYGNYDLLVVQKVRGEEYGAEDLAVDYGRGVDITSPVGQADADDNGRIVVLGDAQKKTPVELYEVDADGKIVGEALGRTTSTNPTDGDKGTFRIVVNNLDEREYKIVAQQHGKGNNITTSDPVVINPGQSNVVAPTAEVVFDADVTKKATVTGTGVDGATITVKNGTQTLGTTTVAGGEWSLPIDPIGAGQHTLTIEQNGAEGTQTATTVADYGNAVEFTTADGVSFADGKLTVAGKSVQGAKIAIRTGGKQVDSFTVDRADGSFSRELSGLGSGTISLTATADSRGGLRTEDALAATSPVHVEALSVASHVKGGTFVPGTQAFTGHATAGATVSLNPFGFDPKYAAQTLTTTANQFGEWTINRGLADVPYPFISFKQTPQTGVVNELINYDLKPYREIGQPGDLTLTNFKAGDYYNPGDQIFTGTATPGATVTLNPFGFDPRFASYNLVTTADETTGQWQIRRGLAAGTLYRELAVKQDPEAEGKVNRIEKITVAANDWVGAPADLKLTGPDTTFTPGTEQTFTGTATPGTTVTLYPFGDDRYADIKMTTKVDATGAWTIKRSLANQAYPIVVTQTEQTGKVNRVAQTMTPAN